MATSRGSNGALSCRDDHGWRRGRNLCALPLQTTNDYSKIGRLNEEEILMPAVTGVLFKWPLIRQIRGRGYGTGMEAMSDKTRAMYATEDASGALAASHHPIWIVKPRGFDDAELLRNRFRAHTIP